MPGLRILHYMVDIGYAEPTRVYAVLQESNGDLKMQKIQEMKDMSLEWLYRWYMELEIRKPIVFVDEPHPPVKEFFRSKGVRVR